MNKETMIKYALKSFANEKQQAVQSSTPEKKTSWWNRKKQQPVSPLTLEEQRILRKVKSRAHFLDRGLSCCCFQVGFDGLVGFIPVIGDFIGVLLAIQLVYIAMSLELPNELVSKMMFNIAFDFVIGLVPLVGDILDIMYKCNTKNAILLENYLIKRSHNRKDTISTSSTPANIN